MDADDGTARMLTPPAGEPRPFTPQFLAQRTIQEAEANRERREAAERRAVKEARKSAKKKKRSRKKAVAETIISQSSARKQMPSDEEAPAMDVVGLPEEEHLPDWMSQLFDKLDSEVKEDGACSTGKVAQVDIHLPLERGISSEIHRPSEEKDSITAELDSGMHEEELSDWMSQLFEKLDLEVNEDNICSTGNVTQVEAHPVAEVISSKIRMSTKLKDWSMIAQRQLRTCSY